MFSLKLNVTVTYSLLFSKLLFLAKISVQALLQSNLDIVLSILGTCNLVTKIKDLYTCVEKKFKFFADYNK